MPTLKIVPQKEPPTVIFCLPGANFSSEFLLSWSELLAACIESKRVKVRTSPAQDANVYYVRNKCLGGDVLRGTKQLPYNGEKYDYIMWIDSDIVFTPDHFLKLLQYDLDIVSGLYMMQGGRQYAAVKDWDEEFFKKHGYFQFLTPEDIKGKTKLIEVAYSGFGFKLIKRGVFEKIGYPWFRPVYHQLTDQIRDFSSEDVSFCRLAIEQGFKIWADPTVVVGHQKRVIL